MALLVYSSDRNRSRINSKDRLVSTNVTAAATDAALLQRIARKDESAVGELYDKYATYLYTLILHVVRVEEEAEDSLQEVFVRIWEKATTYNESLGAPVVWMTRIARNLAIDKLRSKLGHLRKLEVDIAVHGELRSLDPGADPEQATILSVRRNKIVEALRFLPAEQRTLIEHAYFQGFTQSELAEKFRLPLGTVKTRMRTGMSTLRRHLEGLV